MGLISQTRRPTSAALMLDRHAAVGEEVAGQPDHVGHDAHELGEADVAWPDDPEHGDQGRPRGEQSRTNGEQQPPIHAPMIAGPAPQ